MDDEKAKISTTTDGKPAAPGLEHSGAPQPINSDTGQHGAYWVLSKEEREKGFVRPVRRSYVHVGTVGPGGPLRDLTELEKQQYSIFGYVKYEAYADDSRSAIGRFWTQLQLDKINGGCGTSTTMGQAIAETYARDPKYYGSTFCVNCKSHLPVDEFRWEDGSVLGS
jgi:hypothetical protein